MKKFLESLISRKQKAIETMRQRVKDSQDIEEVRSLGQQIEAAQAEIEEARVKLAECNTTLGGVRAEMDEGDGGQDEGGQDEPEEDQPDNNARSRNFAPGRVVASFDTRSNAPQARAAEARAKAFMQTGRQAVPASETRAVLVSGGKIATPTEVGAMQDAFNEVSSIVDMVKAEDCTGMGAYDVPFEVSSAAAADHTEGAEVAESDPVFGYAHIAPQEVAVVSRISRKVRKLSPVNYEDRVRRSALTALRKKASSFIVSKIKASEQTAKKTITAVDEKTVRNIALAYGGDEEIAGNAVLVLNKVTLTALGDVRGTNEKQAVYKITPHTGNTNRGTIEEGGLVVEYCLNSNLADNEFIYGNMMCFELGLFGDYEILVSEDADITKLMLTIVGNVDLGGEVVKKNGFIYASMTA